MLTDHLPSAQQDAHVFAEGGGGAERWQKHVEMLRPFAADQVRCKRMLGAVCSGRTPAVPQPSPARVVHERFRLGC